MQYNVPTDGPDRNKNYKTYIYSNETQIEKRMEQRTKQRTKQRIKQYGYQLKTFVYDLIFPPRCIICDQITEPEEGRIHIACYKKLYPVSGPVCLVCGRPVFSDKYEYCYDCSKKRQQLSHQDNPDKSQTVSVMPRNNPNLPMMCGKALFLYQGDIKQTMYRFKYGNKREYAVFFAEYACSKYGKWIAQQGIEAIVPVPMYRRKQKGRGYNQAEVFAKELGVRTGLPVCRNIIRRVRDTVPQKELNDQMRKKNLENAFQIVQNVVEYRYILLVDDIYTTGSTAEVIAQTLQDAGVRKVFLLNICIGKGF